MSFPHPARPAAKSGSDALKPVILSADNAPRVYLVPEWVAAHLDRYDEGDFIRWLGRWVCPEEPPVLLEILPDGGELPARLRDAPSFLF